MNASRPASTRALVAGVGNIFHADDGFGVAVCRELKVETLPPGTRVLDAGIRALHLAYELLEPLDLLVVVDAVDVGGAPGTIYLIEPDLDAPGPAVADAHGMNLSTVFTTLRALGGTPPRTLIVGCQPQRLDEQVGLSPEVRQAVPRALATVDQVLWRELGTPMKEATP